MEADVRGSILQSKPDVIFDTTFGRYLEAGSKFLTVSPIGTCQIRVKKPIDLSNIK